MSREYDVTECSEECGLLVAGKATWYTADMAVEDIVRDRHENGMDAYCPGCGTRIGIDERGPWREARVPMAALEYMVEFVPTCPPDGPYPSGCPAETDGSGDFCTRCWVSAALRAAEEANSNAD